MLLSILMVLSALPLVGAADYTTTEVWRGYGELGMDLGHPQINSSGQIVWVGYDGNYQIYFYSYGMITKVTNDSVNHGYPMINDRGQFIWRAASGANSIDTIYLYNNGSISQITSDAVLHQDLQINDIGQLVWWSSGSDNQIYSYNDGVTTQITSNYGNSSATINNYGQIAFVQRGDIYSYNTGIINQITDNSNAENGRPQINDHGEIAWFGSDGNDIEIYLYQNGTITQLTNNMYIDISPQIDARGQVVWFGSDGHDQEIYFYSNGSVRQITNDDYDDHDAQINDNGQIVWAGGDGQYDQIFTYCDGTITQITNTAYSNYEPRINDSGQIVWYAFEDDNLVLYEATPAQLNNYSKYDFIYYYTNGNGDVYTCYFYTPTLLHTSEPNLTRWTYIYNQSMEIWSQEYKRLNGGYYDIIDIANGFATSNGKKNYITAYHDANTVGTSLGVNSNGSTTAGNVYVADRTAAWESGYAISGSPPAAFDPYTDGRGTNSISSTALLSSAPAAAPISADAAQSQDIWTAYWNQTTSWLDGKY